jgi:hypothetical protein
MPGGSGGPEQAAPRPRTDLLAPLRGSRFLASHEELIRELEGAELIIGALLARLGGSAELDSTDLLAIERGATLHRLSKPDGTIIVALESAGPWAPGSDLGAQAAARARQDGEPR